MLLAPIGNPEPRDASRLPARSVLQNAKHFEVSTGDPHPSGHPHIFLENGTQTVKMQFDAIPQKIQTGLFSEPRQQKKSCFDAAASKDENVKNDDYYIEARNENENNRNHR